MYGLEKHTHQTAFSSVVYVGMMAIVQKYFNVQSCGASAPT